MNEIKPPPSQNQPTDAPGDMVAALFANMVVQQTNMALMFLGQMPHPETGEHISDLEAAKMFIDTLEMLEVKTKGNLDKREEALLKRNLTALRMAFVEAVNQKEPSTPQAGATGSTPRPAPASPAASAGAATGAEPAASPSEEESRKKFSKKY